MTPSTQPVPMFCDCGHTWTQIIIVGVAVNVFAAFLKSLVCPKCGKRDTILLGRKADAL